MKTKKKYKMTNETMEYNGSTLHRIKALIDIPGPIPVHKGDLGGWIESERNLSQKGKAWIFNEAKVYDYAMINGDAHITDLVEISGCAVISDRAKVINKAKVHGAAYVYGDSFVMDNSIIINHARVHGHTYIADNSCISDDAEVYGNAIIYGDAYIHEKAFIGGEVSVRGEANIGGRVHLRGNEKILSDAYICDEEKDIMCVTNVGSRFDRLTAFRTANGEVKITAGCFVGTIKEFEAKVKETHGNNKYAKEYNEIIKLIKIHFEIKKERKRNDKKTNTDSWAGWTTRKNNTKRSS